MIDQFRVEVAAARGRVLLVDDGTAVARRRSRAFAGTPVRWSVLDAPPEPQSWSGVAFLVSDRQSLRRLVTGLPVLGASDRVWCWIEDCGGWAPSPALRPEWPRLSRLTVRSAGAAFVSARFASPAPSRDVFIGIVGGSSTQRRLWSGQPLLGATPQNAARWVPASPGTLVAESPSQLHGEGRSIAADALLVGTADDVELATPRTAHPVTGRTAQAVVVQEPLPWALLDSGSLLDAPPSPALGVLDVPPIDERIINPVGFQRDVNPGVARIDPSLRDPGRVTVQMPGVRRDIDLRLGLSDSDVRAMRSLQGVELGWRGGPGPQAYVRFVAGLAMAGVPIARTVVPRWAKGLLDDRLRNELESPADLDDRLGREERSVRLRRAGLRAHSISGWRRRLARTHQLPEPRRPRVSVLLATRRPDMVAFALRQVAKQLDASGEVILSTHGFEADESIRSALDDVPGWELRLIAQPATMPFGTVLNQAAERATGDLLLKMDDDDWYGPHFVADLVDARVYSGADIVGTPAEFIFLTPLWRTVRRPDFTERYAPIVAGGTIMIDRTTFADVGGFRPVRRAVDAGLLTAVREGGGSVFRAHGLGYLLRREGGGHTWDPGLGYFLTRSRVAAQWHGFRPSGELFVAEADRPSRSDEISMVTTGVTA
jgi:hypothetical protein